MQIAGRKESNQLTARAGYIKYFHTSQYITSKWNEFENLSSEDEILRLSRLTGFDDRESFLAEMNSWNRVKKDIPVIYLESIGVDPKTLDFTLELDLAEYEKELSGGKTSRFASTRVMKGLYQHLSLPDDISESKAEEILKAFSEEIGQKSAIHYPDLKLTVIHPEGKVTKIYFPPHLEKKGEFLVRDDSGENY